MRGRIAYRIRINMDTYPPSIPFLYNFWNIEYVTGYVSTSGIRPSPTNAPYLPESPSRRLARSQLAPPPAQGLRPTRRPPAMSLHPLRAINQLLLHLQTAALMSTYQSAIATASIAASYARHAPPLAGRRRRASAPSEASFDFSPPPNCRSGEHSPVRHGRSQLPQCRGEDDSTTQQAPGDIP